MIGESKRHGVIVSTKSVVLDNMGVVGGYRGWRKGMGVRRWSLDTETPAVAVITHFQPGA